MQECFVSRDGRENFKVSGKRTLRNKTPKPTAVIEKRFQTRSHRGSKLRSEWQLGVSGGRLCLLCWIDGTEIS